MYRLEADQPVRHARRKSIGLLFGLDIRRPGQQFRTFCCATNRRRRLSRSGPSFCFPTPARSSTSDFGTDRLVRQNCERVARWTLREGDLSDASVPMHYHQPAQLGRITPEGGSLHLSVVWGRSPICCTSIDDAALARFRSTRFGSPHERAPVWDADSAMPPRTRAFHSQSKAVGRVG